METKNPKSTTEPSVCAAGNWTFLEQGKQDTSTLCPQLPLLPYVCSVFMHMFMMTELHIQMEARDWSWMSFSLCCFENLEFRISLDWLAGLFLPYTWIMVASHNYKQFTLYAISRGCSVYLFWEKVLLSCSGKCLTSESPALVSPVAGITCCPFSCIFKMRKI